MQVQLRNWWLIWSSCSPHFQKSTSMLIFVIYYTKIILVEFPYSIFPPYHALKAFGNQFDHWMKLFKLDNGSPIVILQFFPIFLILLIKIFFGWELSYTCLHGYPTQFINKKPQITSASPKEPKTDDILVDVSRSHWPKAKA